MTEYQRRYPSASLREMHDAILNSGSLPPRLMRLRLFGAEGARLERKREAAKSKTGRTRKPARKSVSKRPAAKATRRTTKAAGKKRAARRS